MKIKTKTLLFRRLLTGKVHIFWEAKCPSYFWLALHRRKVRWRLRKNLWPSQNIWTLPFSSLRKSNVFVLIFNNYSSTNQIGVVYVFFVVFLLQFSHQSTIANDFSKNNYIHSYICMRRGSFINYVYKTRWVGNVRVF